MKIICMIAALILGTAFMGPGALAASYVPQSVVRDASMQASTSVEIGMPAPGFQMDGVLNNEFKVFSLSDYRGRWVVLFFYPGDFTFVWCWLCRLTVNIRIWPGLKAVRWVKSNFRFCRT